MPFYAPDFYPPVYHDAPYLSHSFYCETKQTPSPPLQSWYYFKDWVTVSQTSHPFPLPPPPHFFGVRFFTPAPTYAHAQIPIAP